MVSLSERVGVVVIGRNEGERLRSCLASVAGRCGVVVYVDSGSTDGSVELARRMGAAIVELDRSLPFSAARARNAGFERMIELAGELDFVQFVDGDCEINSGWWERGMQELERRPEVAAVCGRLRERHPEASVYNRLCDLEWDRQPGEVAACGGVAMYRISSFREAHGFNPAVTAGEEPELCLRLRQRGAKIVRLPDEMGWHDAAMTRFGQWWRRAVRGGYAFAQGAAMHGRSPQRHCVKESRSNWFWGLMLPVVLLILAWPAGGWSALGMLAYPILGFRIYRHMRRRGYGGADARRYAVFCLLGKLPQAWGQVRYLRDRLFVCPARLIEYKSAAPVASAGKII